MATKLNEMKQILVRNYLARIATIMLSKPALGKTETVEAFCVQMQKRLPEFRLWRFYVPTLSPMDIQASAPDYEKGVLRVFNNELLPNHYSDPDAKGAIFMDEILLGGTEVVKLLQKYINGEDMGGLRKPEGVVVIAASNRLEDKSGVQQHGRAFLSRMEQHEVYSEAGDNLDFMAVKGWHLAVQLFLQDNPALIDNYDEVFATKDSVQASAEDKAKRVVLSEEGKRGVWANMRTWERISKKEKVADEVNAPLSLSEISGNVGSAVAALYYAHRTMMQRIAKFDDIMNDPSGIRLPSAPDEQHAMAMVVASRCSENQFLDVKKFATRLDLELQAAILRYLSKRKGFELASAPGYAEWMAHPQLCNMLMGK